jgi:hypothetical protein
MAALDIELTAGDLEELAAAAPVGRTGGPHRRCPLPGRQHGCGEPLR